MDRNTILGKIAALSEKHILKQSPTKYVEGFVDALMNVYPAASLESVLQQKFFVPDETHYSDKTYCEYACELTVANHVRLTGNPNFNAEKKLNQSSDKDVDAYCDVGAFNAAIEVKCPELSIDEYDSANPIFKISFMGRYDDYEQKFEELRRITGSAMQVEMAKRLDNKLKDYLISGHNKFRNPSQPGDANVLFVALDDYYSMVEFNGYLFSDYGGFFGPRPFVDREKYRQVDVVILSNLQSAHTIGRDHHDWTLKNIYMIPRITRNPRPGLTDLAIAAALSLFPHEMPGFSAFQPYSGPDEMLATASEFTKITHYAVEKLSEEDRKRYFPVPTKRIKSQAEAAAREASEKEAID